MNLYCPYLPVCIIYILQKLDNKLSSTVEVEKLTKKATFFQSLISPRIIAKAQIPSRAFQMPAELLAENSLKKNFYMFLMVANCVTRV